LTSLSMPWYNQATNIKNYKMGQRNCFYIISVSISLVLCSLNSSYHFFLAFLILLYTVPSKPKNPRTVSAVSSIICLYFSLSYDGSDIKFSIGVTLQRGLLCFESV